MIATREQIYQALYDLIKGLTWVFQSQSQSFKYTSRRMLSWDNVNIGQQPSLFVRQIRESSSQQVLALEKKLFRAQIWIYMQSAPNAGQDGNWPSQQINPMLDSLDSTMSGPVPGEKQTLGGKVEHAWIDGDILVDDPVAPDTQIIIFVPVSMLTGL
jgi:hypothetical protein